MKIDSDALYAKLVAYSIEQCAMSTSEIQNSSHWQRIAPQTIHNRSHVAQPVMCSSQFYIAPSADLCWNASRIVEDFGYRGPARHECERGLDRSVEPRSGVAELVKAERAKHRDLMRACREMLAKRQRGNYRHHNRIGDCHHHMYSFIHC